ncbi:MAG: carboxypeptidase-like regulatory domain-containing protein [Prevotella sp.]|nr:carboxypeptidase-like regulatory domain-containing protein [Prevotella sp.]
MKRLRYIMLLAGLMSLSLQTICAQRITRSFRNTSMSEALTILAKSTKDYRINFMYDELEDFTVTTSIVKRTAPDAIRQIMGFYPMKMTIDGENIFVECTQKTPTKMIGRIIDNKNRPVDFANVALLNVSDSSLINGGVTNENGQFVIPCEATKAIVRVSCVGYHTAVDTYNTGKIGTITLKEATMNLQKVVVKAERGHVVKKKGNVKTFFFSHHANETKDIYTALTEVPDLRIDPTMKTISLAKGGAP